MGHARLTYLAVLCGTALWCAAIVAAPLLSGHPGLQQSSGQALYSFFGRICHQLPDRSPRIDGNQLAVCMRCSAIYFGFLAGVMLIGLRPAGWRWSPASRTFALIALFPMMVDVVAGMTGFLETANPGRAITGAWFGILSSWIVVPALTDRAPALSKGVSHE